MRQRKYKIDFPHYYVVEFVMGRQVVAAFRFGSKDKLKVIVMARDLKKQLRLGRRVRTKYRRVRGEYPNWRHNHIKAWGIYR